MAGPGSYSIRKVNQMTFGDASSGVSFVAQYGLYELPHGAAAFAQRNSKASQTGSQECEAARLWDCARYESYADRSIQPADQIGVHQSSGGGVFGNTEKALVTNKFVPSVVIPPGPFNPVIRDAFTTAPAVVYCPTVPVAGVPRPKFVT